MAKEKEPKALPDENQEKSLPQKGQAVLPDTHHKKRKAKRRLLRKLPLFLIPVLFLAILAAYLRFHESEKEPQPPLWVQQFPLRENLLIAFEDFIIPINEGGTYTYIALGIFFKAKNEKTKGELMKRTQEIRSRLYDALREELKNSTDVPPLERIKDQILMAAIRILGSGKVDEVYVSKFFAR